MQLSSRSKGKKGKEPKTPLVAASIQKAVNQKKKKSRLRPHRDCSRRGRTISLGWLAEPSGRPASAEGGKEVPQAEGKKKSA